MRELQVLSKLSVMLMDEHFTNSPINVNSVDEFLSIIDDAEAVKDANNEPKKEEKVSSGAFIVDVTACPTGIAHTYMAAEAIEKKGKRIRIPDQG